MASTLLKRTDSLQDVILGRGPGRIHALDVARALAIVGMITSHLMPFGAPPLVVVHGYPSGLFAVLAGISLSIFAAPKAGRSERDTRLAVLVRGVLILLIGIVLSSVQSLVAIVLVAVAMIYLLLGPVARWRTRNIVILLVALTVVAPIVANVLTILQNYSDWLSGPYPLHAWLAYGVAGILFHRCVLRASVGVQALCAAVGLGVGVWSVYLRRGDEAAMTASASMEKAGMKGDGAGLDWLANYAHSGSMVDIAFTAAMAVGVIAALLLVFREGKSATAVASITYPARAMGAMSLTVYTLHALSAQWLKGQEVMWSNLRTLVDPHAEIDYGTEDSFGEVGPGAFPWETFQERVSQLSGWEEYWDFEANELWGGGSMYSSYADSSSAGLLGDYSWMPFLITVLGALVLCSVWKLFFVKGPAEAVVSLAVNRTLAADGNVVSLHAGASATASGTDKNGDDQTAVGDAEISRLV